MDDDLRSNDRIEENLRGFGLLGVLAILLILGGNFLFTPLSAILVLVWTKLSRTPWREVGFVRPVSWLRTAALGLAFGIALKFAMKAVVMPLLGAPPINQAFQYLTGNRAALPEVLFLAIIGAGFGEEILFRGFLFERFGNLLGSSVWAKAFTVLITTVSFGLSHYSFSGIHGVQQATIVGLVYGTIFAFTRRLWFLIFAHSAFNLTAVAMIYWNLESDVAHLIFR